MIPFMSWILIGIFDINEQSCILSLLNFIEYSEASDFSDLWHIENCL